MHVCFVFDDIILEQQPLGPCYISSILKQHGHTVSSINIADPRQDYVEAVRELDPHLLAYSVASNQSPMFQQANARLKKAFPDKFTLFGSHHPSYFPQVLQEDEYIDAICLGEGEYATLELCDALDAGKDFSGIYNLHVKKPNGEIVKNPTRPLLNRDELSSMPFPDRDLIAPYEIYNYPMGFSIAGRGCPYDCTFCFNHVSRSIQEGKWTRQRTPESVIEEAKWLRDRYGVKYIAFQDDTFVLNRRWMREFCPAYGKEVGVPFLCHVRADLTDEESADLLKQANCIRVAMGIESGDNEIRKTILAKNITTDQFVKASALLNERNIKIIGSNMVGVPGETIDTVLSTIQLNIDCDVHINTIYFFAPFPGTKLGEIALEHGFSGDMNEIPRNYQDRLTDTLLMDHKDIIERIGQCGHLFTSYPWIFKIVKTAIETVPSHLFRMKLLGACLRLKREIMRRNGGRLPRHWHQPRFVEEFLTESMRKREIKPICEHISNTPVVVPTSGMRVAV